MFEPHPIHTIAIYPRPHPDPICAIFLLRHFGEEAFPGAGQAKVVYWNQVPSDKTADQWEEEGVLLIDLGHGKFDHHGNSHATKQDCAATLVAKYLGVDQKPELKKLLQYVKRDDLEGKGIVSNDVIDRAFGLSAIVMNLNRDYPNHPDYVVDIVYRIFTAHYHEEYRRKVLMPQEWAHLREHGKATQFTIPTDETELRVIMVETDSKAMIGFLRALRSIQADIVVQRTSSGHTNIVTRQTKSRLDLRKTIALLRQAEAKKRGERLTNISIEELQQPGRLRGVDEWYYDTAANTLQNGGAATEGITPTALTLQNIRQVLEKTLAAVTNNNVVHNQTLKTISLSDLPSREETRRQAPTPPTLP